MDDLNLEQAQVKVLLPALKGPRITTALFGGIFTIDGAGHFPGLELINFIVCCADGILPDGSVKNVKMRRMSHDFARRLAADVLPVVARSQVLLDEQSGHAVANLLRCLELQLANTNKPKSWEHTHFFPYTRSLVHWDARPGRAIAALGESTDIKVSIERRYLRGGGAFAFSVLRHDPDSDRLAAIRDGFGDLYPSGTDTPLETLAATLLVHGAKDSEPMTDVLESLSVVHNDRWDDLYRDGMRNIVGHDSASPVQRIRAVMNWTGIWLVLMEAARCAEYLDRKWGGLVLDCAGTHPQLRRASQKCLKEHLARIDEAANGKAISEGGHINDKQVNHIKGFFSNTAAICGLLNSTKGRRHFTIKLDAIDALVLAATSKGQDMTFEHFISEWLWERCGLIIGRDAAARAGMLNAFDASIFEENERQFSELMRTTGMLTVYSDATRMVSVEGAQ